MRRLLNWIRDYPKRKRARIAEEELGLGPKDREVIDRHRGRPKGGGSGQFF
jgi:hypothetical protein